MLTYPSISRLHKSFFTRNHISKKQIIFWFTLSITVSIVYAILALQQAFSSEYVVQDDARQHVFWMMRYVDPNLFPNDLIADYFQSVAPFGYSSLYKTFAFFGISPLFLNKLIPSILGILTTIYCFGFSLQIIPLPFTAFLSTLIFNQNIWMKDDLSSGTARAFTYLFLLAFLYYLSRKSLLPCLAVIVLLGIFYPQYVFICVGILIVRLWDWSDGRLRFSGQNNYLFSVVGIVVAFLVMLPYALKSPEFGPVITVAQAKQLPEFWWGGRTAFFRENLVDYFLSGRSGMFAPYAFSPVTLIAAFFLPLMRLFPAKFPLLAKIQREIIILIQLLIVSVGMFVLAHLFLFKFYLPSRYTDHSFRVILAVSAAIVFSAIIEAILSSFNTGGNSYFHPHLRKFFSSFLISFIAIGLLFYYPVFVKNFPKTAYQEGSVPALYEFFQKQPKDILIASIAREADNLPAFSQRSILVGREYAVPYHFGYYSQFRQRVIDLIQAQYSENLLDVTTFIQKYGVDYWLLESEAFIPEYIQNNLFLKQYYKSNLNQDILVKITKDIFDRLHQKNLPALSQTIPNCTVAKVQNFTVLDAKCILNTVNN